MKSTSWFPQPLYVHDETFIKDGNRNGTIDIKTNDRKWVGDVKPYGGTFPSYEEAKKYAKLFAASPEMLDMLVACKEFIKTHMHYPGEGMIDKIQQVIDTATT